MSIFKGAISPLRSELTTAGYTEATDTIPSSGDSILLLENFANSNIVVQVHGAGISLAAGLVNQNPAVTQVDATTFISYNKTYVKPSGLRWLEELDVSARAELLAVTGVTNTIDPSLYTLNFVDDGSVVGVQFQDVFQDGSIMIPFQDLDYQLDQLPNTLAEQDPVLKIGTRTFTRAQVLANRFLIPGTTDRYFLPIFICCTCLGSMPNLTASVIEPTTNLSGKLALGAADLSSTAKVGWAGINTVGSQYKPSDSVSYTIGVSMKTFTLSQLDLVPITASLFDAISATYTEINLINPDEYVETIDGLSSTSRSVNISYAASRDVTSSHFLQVFSVTNEIYGMLSLLANQDDQNVLKYVSDVSASEMLSHTVEVDGQYYYGHPYAIADGASTDNVTFDADSDKYDTWSPISWTSIITQVFESYNTAAILRNPTTTDVMNYIYPSNGTENTGRDYPYRTPMQTSIPVLPSDMTLLSEPLTLLDNPTESALLAYTIDIPMETTPTYDLELNPNHALTLELDGSVGNAITALALTNPTQVVLRITESYPTDTGDDWSPSIYEFTAEDYQVYGNTFPIALWNYYRSPDKVLRDTVIMHKSIEVSLDNFENVLATYEVDINPTYADILPVQTVVYNDTPTNTPYTGNVIIPSWLSGVNGIVNFTIVEPNVGNFDDIEKAFYGYSTSYHDSMPVVDGNVTIGADVALAENSSMSVTMNATSAGTIYVNPGINSECLIQYTVISATPLDGVEFPTVATDDAGNVIELNVLSVNSVLPEANYYAKSFYLKTKAIPKQLPEISCANATNTFSMRTAVEGVAMEVKIDDNDWTSADSSIYGDWNIAKIYQPMDAGATFQLTNNGTEPHRIRLRATEGEMLLYVDPSTNINDVEQANQSYVLYDSNGVIIDPRFETDHTGSSIDNPESNDDYVIRFSAVDFCLSKTSPVIQCDGATNDVTLDLSITYAGESGGAIWIDDADSRSQLFDVQGYYIQSTDPNGMASLINHDQTYFEVVAITPCVVTENSNSTRTATQTVKLRNLESYRPLRLRMGISSTQTPNGDLMGATIVQSPASAVINPTFTIVSDTEINVCLSPAPNVISCDGAVNQTQWLYVPAVQVKIDGNLINDGAFMTQDELVEYFESDANTTDIILVGKKISF